MTDHEPPPSGGQPSGPSWSRASGPSITVTPSQISLREYYAGLLMPSCLQRRREEFSALQQNEDSPMRDLMKLLGRQKEEELKGAEMLAEELKRLSGDAERLAAQDAVRAADALLKELKKA